MNVLLVSHSHWDREWHRTFESFRARLVDLVDRVLDLCAAAPDYRFLLDGQTIVLDDYLAIRPERAADLAAACRAGQVAIGPWYVQPDSFLPSGETHVRNLLEGRRTGAAVGPVSRVAYCPDSFGHPAQFPQLFAGFGLGPFVYWRGNGDELDRLPTAYRWEAPDGSAVAARHLPEGYFAASGLPADPVVAAAWLRELATALAGGGATDPVLLMNGFDHAVPEASAPAALAALRAATGWTVTHGLLDDLPAPAPSDAPVFRGELAGARAANLLPGVWSARLGLKLRNRRCETLLTAWAEPWSALAGAHGLPDERAALRLAWRALLQNQAHDSIGGCSIDAVHEQMTARYDTAEELAVETTTRVLERLAGCDLDRRSPWDGAFDVAVFNPSPVPRTDLVRFTPRPREWIAFRGEEARGIALHPWLQVGLASQGYTADGAPARLVADEGGDRIRLLPDLPPQTIEFVVRDVPAFGWTRVRLAPGPHAPDVEDDEPRIAVDDVAVHAAADGTLDVSFGSRTFTGLGGVEDVGDRGDSYDLDPVPGPPPALEAVVVRRRREPTGVASLVVARTFRVPARLAADRAGRVSETVPVVVETTVRLVPGTGRVDLEVCVLRTAADHRLRLLFPTGAPVDGFLAATTFDVTRRSTRAVDAARWVHPAPTTFPHQGFVAAGGLCVVAPGLPEAEVTAEGVIAITLARAVSWLARLDLRTRPQPAGPTMPTPGAQHQGPLVSRLALLDVASAARAQSFETGLRAVTAGAHPLVPPGVSLLSVAPAETVLSAFKPADDGDGAILRLSNPTDDAVAVRVGFGRPVASLRPVRLDEQALDASPCAPAASGGFAVDVPAHALRSWRVRFGTLSDQ